MNDMTSPRIEAEVFDAMYTLIMAKVSRRELLARVYTDDFRVKINPKLLDKIIREVREGTPASSDYTRNWILQNQRIMAKVRRVPVDRVTEAEALAKHVRVLSDASLYAVHRETRDMLRFAQKHFRLAIASNQEERYLLPMLERFKIAHYFEKVICSDKLGVSKPKLEFFQRAYEELGVAPHAACYVGNSIRNDLPASYLGPLVLIDYDGNLRITETGGGLTHVTVVRSMKRFRRWLEERTKPPTDLPPCVAVNE